MNVPVRSYVMSDPESQAPPCHEYQLLKQGYESALREVELYESGGAASIQQSIRYQGDARAISDAARDHLTAHSEDCLVCGNP